jgi:hypothetical protein
MRFLFTRLPIVHAFPGLEAISNDPNELSIRESIAHFRSRTLIIARIIGQRFYNGTEATTRRTRRETAKREGDVKEVASALGFAPP